MDNKIIKVDETTWIIEEGMVRFFLLEGSKKSVMIDCGMMTKNARDIAESLTGKPVELILTHADRDHIGSIMQFDTFYMSGSEASNLYGRIPECKDFIPVSDMDTLDLGERELLIISIPGHTPGSIAILDKNSKMIFTGDPFQDGNIFMFGIQREMHAYLHSLNRMEKLADKDLFIKIYPSHGSYPLGTDVLGKLRDDYFNTINGNIVPVEVDMHGNKALLYKGATAGFLCSLNYNK